MMRQVGFAPDCRNIGGRHAVLTAMGVHRARLGRIKGRKYRAVPVNAAPSTPGASPSSSPGLVAPTRPPRKAAPPMPYYTTSAPSGSAEEEKAMEPRVKAAAESHKTQPQALEASEDQPNPKLDSDARGDPGAADRKPSIDLHLDGEADEKYRLDAAFRVSQHDAHGALPSDDRALESKRRSSRPVPGTGLEYLDQFVDPKSAWVAGVSPPSAHVVDASMPQTFPLVKELSKRRSRYNARLMVQHRKEIEHMQRRIAAYSSMKERKKRPYDWRANPTYIRRGHNDLSAVRGSGLPASVDFTNKNRQRSTNSRLIVLGHPKHGLGASHVMTHRSTGGGRETFFSTLTGKSGPRTRRRSGRAPSGSQTARPWSAAKYSQSLNPHGMSPYSVPVSAMPTRPSTAPNPISSSPRRRMMAAGGSGSGSGSSSGKATGHASAANPTSDSASSPKKLHDPSRAEAVADNGGDHTPQTEGDSGRSGSPACDAPAEEPSSPSTPHNGVCEAFAP